MNLFGTEPEEKAMATLIHDTNAAIDSLERCTKKIEEWIKTQSKANHERGEKTDSMPFVAIEYVKSDIKRTQDAIDAYYKKISEIKK